jgi:PKD repeat protein
MVILELSDWKGFCIFIFTRLQFLICKKILHHLTIIRFMKRSFILSIACLTILTALSATATAHPRHSEKEEERERERHKPAQWPAQVITKKVQALSPPVVVNWQQKVAYEAAHPRPSRTGFIGQIEDKDADFKFVPHTMPAHTPTFDPAHLPGARPANAPQHQKDSPTPLGYFLGTAGNGSLVPPDIAGAAGPAYIMETNNQQFEIYNKAGVHQSTLSIDNFFSGGVAGGYFDPHILYDLYHNHWIVVIDGNLSGSNDGGMFIAVSQTSDPTGSWWTYNIDNGDANTNDLLDYPQIGFNNNWLVITANQFVGNATTGYIYVLGRAGIESGTQGTVTTFTDNNAFSWGPAETRDTTTNTLWMVQDYNGGSGAMQIGSITGTVAAPVYNSGNTVAVTSHWNENAVDVQQLGGGTTQLINDDDTRVANGSVFANGQLYFTHAIWLPATGTAINAGADWWVVNPSALTVTQFGRVAAPANGATVTNYYYPTLNVNAGGDILLGYCISSGDSLYASAAYSFHAGTDAANTMQSTYIYKPGVATYYQTLGGGRNRYGDYTGTMIDPVDQSFWNFSEWAQTATKWGTVIAHVATSAPPTSPPSVSFTATPTMNDCGGLVNFTDLSTNSPNAWLWNFGDGTTSNQQSPSHQYIANGNYTVSLTATNIIGSDSQTVTNYITVSLPTGPVANNVSHCGDTAFSLLATATTSGVSWFDSLGNYLSSANPYTTPTLTQSSTFYVQDSVPGPTQNTGPAAYTTLGTFAAYTRTRNHGVVFDALSNTAIISVVVNASTAGTKIIQLQNAGGTVLYSDTFTLVVGDNTLALNFNVPAGGGYQLLALGVTGSASLNYNTAVTGGYPFTVPGVISLTGSGGAANVYYFFYDWTVQGAPCASARTAVVATVGDCLGVENVNGGVNFAVYPNPAMTEVTVDIQDAYTNATISLKDMLGQTLSTTIASKAQMMMNVSAYTEGVYFVEVAQGGKTSVRKLIISK